MKFLHCKDMTALAPGLNIGCRKNLTLPDYAEDKNQPSHRTTPAFEPHPASGPAD